ncbi:hypothetical protein TNCV_4280671 [Trichonephila clavipes]|nr:hypothetical protein TNCV_4280671 [Trichonephila clavipes]
MSQIQQQQIAKCQAVYMTALGESHPSIPTDWMERIDTPGVLNIPKAKSLLVSDLETTEAWECVTLFGGVKRRIHQIPSVVNNRADVKITVVTLGTGDLLSVARHLQT